jgi:exodeoxyribonuclease VII small subunit
MTRGKSEKSFNFGTAYKELEGIIEWFEREDADLDEGLQKFERGLALAKQCKDRLQDVENKVTEIKAKFDGLDREERDTTPPSTLL